MHRFGIPHTASSSRVMGSAGFALAVLTIALVACRSSRISGTYVAHDDTAAAILQLTQAQNGQITGTLSVIRMTPNGRVEPVELPISMGTLDGEQLTLVIRRLGEHNISGTYRYGTIQLQSLGAGATLSSATFVSGSPGSFQSYANELKSKGASIALTGKLGTQIPKLQQTVQSVERWIADAESTTARTPQVKAYYQKVENAMKELLTRKRQMASSVGRVQIAVKISQLNVAANQADVFVDQQWDVKLGNAGRDLNETFSSFVAACPSSSDLSKRGIDAATIDRFETACQAVLAEKVKFQPVYVRCGELRRELKNIQVSAGQRRQAIIREADRIE